MSERMTTGDLVSSDADEPMARDVESTDGRSEAEALAPLFDEQRAAELRSRWQALQARFVDEPREVVEEADSLVAELLQDLASRFNEARGGLEQQWSRGDDVSTEDLRLLLQQYRAFFGRLLEA